MNDVFTDQKEKLVSILNEINLLRQQVNYLLRNEKALGLLDLDVLMNRTHSIYDQLCAIHIGDVADDEPDFDLDAETLAGLFGIEEEPKPADPDPIEPVAPVAIEPVEMAPQQDVHEESALGLPRFDYNDETESIEPVAPVAIESVEMAPKQDVHEESAPGLPRFDSNDETEFIEPIEPETIEPVAPVAIEPVEMAPEPAPEKPLGDEYGFFFRFEDLPTETPNEPETEETEGEEDGLPSFVRNDRTKTIEPVEMEPELPVDTPVVMDDKIVHFVEEIPEEEIPERDRVVADELLKDNTFEMPQMEDSGFEMAVPETLGESMMQEDLTLAAKLQQNPVRDLKSVIGINDKFLFVNELFGGSMEKYNKSVENLNDLKTLNGAMIYLNELKIELQWNSSNEAYQKLTELVKRKFE